MKTITSLAIFIIATPLALAQIEVVGSGNVGIGTSSPATKLHVAGGGGGATFLLDNNGWGAVVDATGNVRRLWGASGDEMYFGNIDNWGGGATHIAASGLLRFWVGDSERVRVTSAGNVGIGTTSPSAPLTVKVVDDDSLAIYGPGNNCVALQTLLDANSLGSYGTYGGDQNRLILQPIVGNVGIGTTSPTQKLEVAGTVKATSFISSTTTYADFVFAPDYRLASLSEVEAHIKAKGHLPDIASEAEAHANGIDLAAMQIKLLQKIEELTLHQIAQEKEMKLLRGEIARLKEEG